MINLAQIQDPASESLSDCLVTQTYSKYAFCRGITFDKVNTNSCFRRDTRSGRKQNFVITFHFVQCDFIIPEDRRCCSRELFNIMHEVIGEGIVIVYYQYLFHFSCN